MAVAAEPDHFVDTINAIRRCLPSGTFSKSKIEAVVRFELQQLPLQIAEPLSFGMRAENLQHAEEIGSLAGQLVEKLERAPKGTRNSLFILASRCEPLRWSLNDPDSPAVKQYRQTLLVRLESLHRACGDVAAPGNVVGDHHRPDNVKQLCAGCALDLIVGLDAGKPTSSSVNSPIRVIASSLFEAVAPTRGAKGGRHNDHDAPDLREQCVEVIAYWRNLSATEKKAHVDGLRTGWTKFTGMMT
jgi:hypothetical protein